MYLLSHFELVNYTESERGGWVGCVTMKASFKRPVWVCVTGLRIRTCPELSKQGRRIKSKAKTIIYLIIGILRNHYPSYR